MPASQCPCLHALQRAGSKRQRVGEGAQGAFEGTFLEQKEVLLVKERPRRCLPSPADVGNCAIHPGL